MRTAFHLAVAACLGTTGGTLLAGAARAGMPDQVGACVATSIILIGTHQPAVETGILARPTPVKVPARTAGPKPGPALGRTVSPTVVPAVGHVVGYANAGAQISTSMLPEIARSLLNDRVQMCLVASTACSQGAPAGRTYRVTNERTREAWTLPEPQRRCAGS